MDFLAYIKEAGPFTAPLCIAIVLGMRWLLKDRERLLSLLAEANSDRMQLREKRAEDLERAANEYREHGEAMRDAVREWRAKADAVLERVAGAR